MFMFKKQDEQQSRKAADQVINSILNKKYGFGSIKTYDSNTINVTDWSIIDLDADDRDVVCSIKEATHRYLDSRLSFQWIGKAFGIDLHPDDSARILAAQYYGEIDKYENQHGV